MNVEWSPSLVARAQLHAALGEPARLAIVDRLLLGDASPGGVGRELGLPSNLLSHHLKLLEQTGVLERTWSEGDQRRTYLRLRTDALVCLVPTSPRAAPRVVFVCTHNSARSQLAAALWRKRSKVPTAPAGTEPVRGVHPLAVAAARGRGRSLSRAPAHTDHLHWSVPDPSRVGTGDAFDDVLRDLAGRVARLAPAVSQPGVNE